ncbi:MAG TPA: lipopolysaccharide biosynthesis protein [Lacipirellulaceae bacterium]|nr:lipopolysaccharide biosynthesis protein [Lacipirellulaceae bacterium]
MNDKSDHLVGSDRVLRPDTLAASVTILLVANLVQRTIGFGRGILFCRWLTPDELGTWDMAYSFLLLAAPIVVLGLPGSFGRYLERFRQRGQLRTFLRRASIWTAALTFVACALIVAVAPLFSDLIFGRTDATTLVVLVALSLVAVILHHFLEALFAALRKYSIVSTMHFCQSMLFAVISLTLLWFWRFSAASIVIGYGLGCLLSAVGILVWKGRAVAAEAAPVEPIAHREFWPPLMGFAIWVWVINLICHLFGVVDRYMLVHFSGLDNTAALALVGEYHASRIIPLLFLSVADLLAGAVMPHLSHDWEAGARERVSDQLNIVLKFTSLVMLAGGVVVLWLAPLLFRVAFQDRYDAGLAVMPWTLTYCAWYSLLLIAQNYVWCAEKMKLGTLPLAAGLAINIAINLVLVPAWGLLGAVVSTTVATGASLGLLYWINGATGMRVDRGTLLISAAPLALCGGAMSGSVVLIVLAALVPFSRTLVTQHERDRFAEFGRMFLERVNAYWANRGQGETSHAV